MKTPREVIKDWLAAYNARDPYALIELYHDDAINHKERGLCLAPYFYGL